MPGPILLSDGEIDIALPARTGIGWNTCIFLVFFYLIAVANGLRSIWYWEHSPLDLLIPISLAFCLALWAFEDARRRKHPIPSLSKPWFLLLAFFVVPGYVIWSRRWRGVGWVALHAFCWTLLGSAVMMVGGIALFGPEWFRAIAGR
jgi:hypothetical protein